jgi:glyoxylase-like metal-dependent hydrolase (beta-lactamase superfamily II)/rhodanese-related sulfurtransferase
VSGRLHLHQYYLGCLSHASYLVGDLVSGRAVVVDPQRDVQQYIDDAAALGMRIELVLETHFHADFLSGHLELAESTGAAIGFGAAAEGRTQFPIRTFADGERILLGASDDGTDDGVTLTVLSTPGHTPESVSIVVQESPDTAPHGVLTGDTLFIGDVGRPDLLGAAGHSSEEMAGWLFHSLRHKLLTLPDATLVYPAHGAGSACGKNLSTETVSTIGEQRRTNYALAPMSLPEFVEAVTQGQSAAPMYFQYAATLNRQEHFSLHEDEPVTMLSFDEARAAIDAGATLIDTRESGDFAQGHLRGAVNVGVSGRFADYVGQVVPPSTPIVLTGGSENEARVRLARIGFDQVVGALGNLQQVMLEHPEQVEQASRLTAAQLDALRGSDVQLVDIRNPGEVAAGSIPEARPIPLSALPSHLTELDRARPIVAFCAGGYRSSIAASYLRAQGAVDVSDLVGGYGAWVVLHP